MRAWRSSGVVPESAGAVVVALAALACVGQLACTTPQPPASYADPTLATSGQGALEATLRLQSPAVPSNVGEPVAEVAVAIVGSKTALDVTVKVANGPAIAAKVAPDGTWRASVGLLPGDNPVVAQVRWTDGTVHQRGWKLRYVGDAPGIRLLSPGPGDPVRPEGFVVTGQVAAGAGRVLAKLELAAEGSGFVAITTEKSGQWHNFSAPMPKLTTPAFLLRATDDKGAVSERKVDVQLDEIAPTIAITAPKQDHSTGEQLLVVKGTAEDALGIQKVQVRAIPEGGKAEDSPWIQADGTTQWQLTMAIAQGRNTIEAKATDRAGNTATTSMQVRRRHTVILQARDPEGPVLKEALEAIKDPVAYGVDTSGWGPAEQNMQKIITMKPDNADFTGTAFEQLGKFSNALGIAVPLFTAAIADIAPTDTFLTTDEVADGFFRTVLSSHPALKKDPKDDKLKLPITLWDALTDLSELSKTLGPAGGHPGILYKSVPSAVLLGNFEMTLIGQSNLRELEGVDLSAGKAWLLAKKPGADVVHFDFLDPDKFKVSGVADEPQVDLFFTVSEHKGFVKAGSTQGANPVDGFPKGDSALWTLPPWTFERLVVDAMYYAYRDRHGPSYSKQWSYDVGTLKGASKVTWDKGWVTISAVANIGNPPPPAYWWGMVAELAQVRLHDGGLKEGDANLRLAVTGVTVPVSAKEIIEQARALFQEQKSKLVAASVGDHGSYDTTCDVALVRRGDGMSLRFVAKSDVPGAKQSHAKPGLFADAALTQKLSSTADDGSGDVVHEKYAVPKDGATVYAQDRDGSTWRLILTTIGNTRLKVGLEKASAP